MTGSIGKQHNKEIGMSVSGCSIQDKPNRVSQIDDWLGRLDRALSVADKAQSDLAKRLQRVLRIEPPSDPVEGREDPEQELTALADEIRKMCHRLEAITANHIDIIDRIEL